MTDPTTKGAALHADDTLSPLLGAYAVPSRHFDELRGANGSLRQEWATFAAAEADQPSVISVCDQVSLAVA